jgi:histone deacetylase 1/2
LATSPSTSESAPADSPTPHLPSPDVVPHPPDPPSSTPNAPRQPDLPPNAKPVEPPQNAHQMHTRAKSGYLMPRRLINLHTTTTAISPLPASYKQALKDPNWHAAMLDEFNALLRNNTWSLVSCLQVRT